MKKIKFIALISIVILWSGNYILNSFDFYKVNKLEKKYNQCNVTLIKEENIKKSKYILYKSECPYETIYSADMAKRNFFGGYNFIALNANSGSILDDEASFIIDPDNELIFIFSEANKIKTKIEYYYIDEGEHYNQSDINEKEIIINFSDSDARINGDDDQYYYKILTYDDLNIRLEDSKKVIISRTFIFPVLE
ncbi:hypothetical protein KHQ81_00145 [Mycoplasmatota bacterium]|nr:hypothetical protein KHQ81_00145 [Mycoplasmatota bacterium]